MVIITPDKELVKRKITEIKKTLSVFRQARLKEEITMVIITPDSDFVKRKTEVKEKPPVCRKAVNEQEVIESYKKMKVMTTITPDKELVKRKIITEAGKNLFAGSLLPTFKTSRQGEIPASVNIDDINLTATKKNAVATPSDVSEEGKRIPLGSKKLDRCESDPISDKLKEKLIVIARLQRRNLSKFRVVNSVSGEKVSVLSFLRNLEVDKTTFGNKKVVWEGVGLWEAYAEFIKLFEPFSWYCTFTFVYDIHPEEANKCFMRLIRKLNEKVVCRRYREKRISGIAWVRALERQKRGVIHFHTLLEHPLLDLVSYPEAYRDWWNSGSRTGKINRIDKYDQKRGARGYLAKYINKGGEIDFSEKKTWIRRFEFGNL